MLRSCPFLDDNLHASWHLPNLPCTLSGYADARICPGLLLTPAGFDLQPHPCSQFE
jgi:hypothetical protein